MIFHISPELIDDSMMNAKGQCYTHPSINYNYFHIVHIDNLRYMVMNIMDCMLVW